MLFYVRKKKDILILFILALLLFEYIFGFHLINFKNIYWLPDDAFKGSITPRTVPGAVKIKSIVCMPFCGDSNSFESNKTNPTKPKNMTSQAIRNNTLTIRVAANKHPTRTIRKFGTRKTSSNGLANLENLSEFPS